MSVKKFVSVITGILGIAVTSGCADQISFERFTGPLSPPGIAMVAAGGLREQLFPGSQRAVQLCMNDFVACSNAGGVKLRMTTAGRAVLENIKTMLALKVASQENDLEFAKACEAFAHKIYSEKDKTAYEVSMRLLAFLTASPKSPLNCAIGHLSKAFEGDFKTRRLDWDTLKLTGYVELMLVGKKIFGLKKALGRGFIRRLGAASLIGASGAITYMGGSGTYHTLDLNRWASESGKLYFVGNFNWSRKYKNPSALIVEFRKQLEGFVKNSDVRSLSEDLNRAIVP